MDEMERSIQEHMASKDQPKPKIPNWPKFVENEVLAFFNAYGIEKMTIEDGEGGKAKLVRGRDNSVKVDLTSTTVY